MARATGETNAYVSYEATRAEEISLKTMQLAERAGFRCTGSRQHWGTTDGRFELYSTGIGGPLTGRGISGVLLVDDPHKNRAEAESPVVRKKVEDWYRGVGISGVQPGGAFINVQARWHPSDLYGTILDTLDDSDAWDVINLPAIVEDPAMAAELGVEVGSPLWPEMYTLEFLDVRRSAEEMGDYDWASLYMGQPRPRGTAVFPGISYYDDAPTFGYRVAIGVDLAYTSKTSSDYCAAVVLAEKDGSVYVLDVRHRQTDATSFCQELTSLKEAYPGARMLWHASTTERGLGDTLRKLLNFPLATALAVGDPFVRAQPVAAAWQRKEILLPRKGASWMPAFTKEVGQFTGVGDSHDDQVVALASAYSQLDRMHGTSKRYPTTQKSKMTTWHDPKTEDRRPGRRSGFQW